MRPARSFAGPQLVKSAFPVKQAAIFLWMSGDFTSEKLNLNCHFAHGEISLAIEEMILKNIGKFYSGIMPEMVLQNS